MDNVRPGTGREGALGYVLERVLKEGTAQPRIPHKLTVSWSTDCLELNGSKELGDTFLQRR
jgi:hypothetical protein